MLHLSLQSTGLATPRDTAFCPHSLSRSAYKCRATYGLAQGALSASEEAKQEDGSAEGLSKIPDMGDHPERMVVTSGLSRLAQELAGHYVSFAEQFLSKSLEKAIAMEQREGESLTTTLVDDAFYIFAKCGR